MKSKTHEIVESSHVQSTWRLDTVQFVLVLYITEYDILAPFPKTTYVVS